MVRIAAVTIAEELTGIDLRIDPARAALPMNKPGAAEGDTKIPIAPRIDQQPLRRDAATSVGDRVERVCLGETKQTGQMG
jgi:hypothetical protein